MSRLVVEIPEDVRAALRLPPDEVENELRRELALALYQRQVLPLGKARLLAHMDRRGFDELLGRRKIPRHYSVEDVDGDLRSAGVGE